MAVPEQLGGHFPPGLSGGPRHVTGKDITVLGLGWRGTSSNQAGWSVASLAERDWSLHWHCIAFMQSRDRGQSHSTDAGEEAAMCNLMPMPRAEGTAGCTRLVGNDFPEVTFRSCTVWGFTIITCEIMSLIETYHFQISSCTNRLVFYSLGSNSWRDSSQVSYFVRKTS